MTLAINLPPVLLVLLILLANLPPDTSGKFATGINGTGGK
jgi:hypothetical protein